MTVAIREIEPEKQALLALYAEDIRLLARLHDRELDATFLAGLKEASFPYCLALKGDATADTSAFEILGGALDGDEGSGTPEALDALHADFAAIYLNHTYSVSPLECVWLDPEGLILQEPMFEIRQWYAHYGLTVQNWRVRSDDHLAYQLEFVAHLLTHPLDHAAKDAAAFMDHHILRWIEPFAARVSTRCQTQFYAGLVLVTVSVLRHLRAELARLAGMPMIELEPIEEEKQRRRAKAQQEAARFMPGAAPSW